jgi:hypothetical protein
MTRRRPEVTIMTKPWAGWTPQTLDLARELTAALADTGDPGDIELAAECYAEMGGVDPDARQAIDLSNVDQMLDQEFSRAATVADEDAAPKPRSSEDRSSSPPPAVLHANWRGTAGGHSSPPRSLPRRIAPRATLTDTASQRPTTPPAAPWPAPRSPKASRLPELTPSWLPSPLPTATAAPGPTSSAVLSRPRATSRPPWASACPAARRSRRATAVLT